MTVGNIQISRGFIVSGDPLPLAPGLSVRHPTVGEIMSCEPTVIADMIYLTRISHLVSDPYDNMVWLDDMGKDYEEVTPYDLFFMKMEAEISEAVSEAETPRKLSHAISCSSALNFFLGDHVWGCGTTDDGRKIIFDVNNPSIFLDGERFEILSAFVRMINGIAERTDKIIPKTPSAKRILIEDMRDEQKRRARHKNDDDNDYVGDALCAVISGGNGGVTWFNYKKLPIYQIMSGMKITQKQLTFEGLLTGVYSGTVKSEALTQKELAWMK